MLALSSGLSQLFVLAGAGILGAIVLGIGRAVMGLMRTRQTTQRQEEFDQRTLAEFFFDTERDSRTGAPPKEGWTTTVNRTLAELKRSQDHTAKIVNEILYELKPNGGGNFRGLVERGVEAAGAEVDKQVEERKRVQDRDERLGHS